MIQLLILTAVAAMACFACRCWYQIGCRDGYKDGAVDGAQCYARTVGGLSMALSNLSAAELQAALNSGTADKVGAILAAMQHKSEKIMLDQKSRLAEFTVPGK